MAGRQAGLIAALVALAPVSAAKVETRVEVGAKYVAGLGMPVRVELTAGDEGDKLPAWMLSVAAFSVDGKPLAARGSAQIDLAPRQKITIEIDLGPALAAAKGVDKGFALAYAGEKPVQVTSHVPAKKGTDFLSMAPEDLARHQVLLRTNRGPLLFDLWPDVAPNHVRNFLDLVASGFYDGTLFHRVSPTFMIQGGDPNTKGGDPASWGLGAGPRTLKREFSAKQHVRGVLSMARGPNPDSATCQFFVMTAPAPSLDGQYTAFGELVEGLAALDAIASAAGQMNPQDRTVKPSAPQKIESAVVLVKGGK